MSVWYRSDHFKGLGDGTQRTYRRVAENLRKQYGQYDAKRLRVQDVVVMLADKADAPNSANTDRRVLCFILDQAVALGLVDTNVARPTRKLPTYGVGFYTWTETDIQTFLTFHSLGTVAHLAVMLLLHTGAGREDVVRFGMLNVVNGRFKYDKQQALDRHAIPFDIPILPALRQCIDFASKTGTFLQTATGAQRSAAGFGNLMRKWCDEAGLKKCTAHGLRKACARRLSDAGATEQQLAAVMAYSDTTPPHSIIGMGNRAGLSDDAIGRLCGVPASSKHYTAQ